MGIERLNKAAMAAGYAMVTPEDDETPAETLAVYGEDAGRAVVPAGQAMMIAPTVAATWSIGNTLAWARSLVPTFGGRAPA